MNHLQRRLIGSILWSPSTALPIIKKVAKPADLVDAALRPILELIDVSDQDQIAEIASARHNGHQDEVWERAIDDLSDGVIGHFGLQHWLVDLQIMASTETPGTIHALAEQLREERRQRLTGSALHQALADAVKADAPADEIVVTLRDRLERIRSDYAPDISDRWAATARTWRQMREDPIPPPISLIGNKLLCSDEIGMIHGRDGSRKSWAMLHLCAALASGTYWFGVQMREAGTRVALVSLEDSESRIQERLEAICLTLAFTDAQRRTIDERLVIVCPPHVEPILDLTSQIGVDSLERLIQRHEPEVLILDHLSRLHMLPDERDLRPVALALLRLTKRYHVATIFSHHDRKPQGGGRSREDRQSAARGDSKLTADCRMLIGLSEAQKGRIRLEWEKTTGSSLPEDVWLAHGDGGALIVIDEPHKAAERAARNRIRLLEMIQGAGSAGVSAPAAAGLLGVTIRTVERYAKELEEEGQIESTGKARSTVYRIATDSNTTEQCRDHAQVVGNNDNLF